MAVGPTSSEASKTPCCSAVGFKWPKELNEPGQKSSKRLGKVPSPNIHLGALNWAKFVNWFVPIPISIFSLHATIASCHSNLGGAAANRDGCRLMMSSLGSHSYYGDCLTLLSHLAQGYVWLNGPAFSCLITPTHGAANALRTPCSAAERIAQSKHNVQNLF